MPGECGQSSTWGPRLFIRAPGALEFKLQGTMSNVQFAGEQVFQPGFNLFKLEDIRGLHCDMGIEQDGVLIQTP